MKISVMISLIIGVVSGVGVKFSYFEKCLLMNIYVRMFMVDLSVRVFISVVLIGSIIELNVKNIKMIVVVSRMIIISGIFVNRLWIEFSFRVGVLLIKIVIFLGGVIVCSLVSFFDVLVGLINLFCRMCIDGFLDVFIV